MSRVVRCELRLAWCVCVCVAEAPASLRPPPSIHPHSGAAAVSARSLLRRIDPIDAAQSVDTAGARTRAHHRIM